MRRLTYLTALLLFPFLAGGCRHSCKHRCGGGSSRGSDLPPPGVYAPANIPPANIPNNSSSFYTPKEEILLPQTQKPQIRESNAPPRADARTVPVQPSKPESTAAKPNDMPLGIADFTTMSEGVWAGLKPDLDGLDWLKARKVAQVVYLRASTDDDSADRQQAEKRGMKFDSLIVRYDTLNQDLYDRFEKLLDNKPVFVYDRSGDFQGYLWYLHLRLKENQPQDVARLRAERLGYNERTPLGQAALKVVETTK